MAKINEKPYEEFSLEKIREQAEKNETNVVLEVNKWIESVKQYSSI